ncbi:helix-turn-helix domain-containing protein [Apilactobacillus sp. TMW 2.2459]|uniref:helix-turn-helix transcriptional regulator n=1 Tax=Apilactobacillus xinyiensis TaxID=2841032 RepID=UPI00200D86D6|nr:helix-turn-helix transcriptional regulator [Apilactobacillus xinyiensis]MCL0312836.1 helix-turn-helix domain-containing protein [Apilactobacillus xinyiensis]
MLKKEGDILFAKNLRYLRTKFDMEQKELAEKLGRKSTGTISDWEAGRYTPKLGTLSDIASIFNVNIDKMMKTDLSKAEDPYNIIGVYDKLNLENKRTIYNSALELLAKQK